MTIAEWLIAAQARLEAIEVEGARTEAQVLAAHVLRVDRSWLIAHPESEFPGLAGESLLQRRELHEPLAYLVGGREFYGRRFATRPGVLIPRPDTESLVDAALDAISPNSTSHLLDIGTGSGAIAVTLKLERPTCQVTATDISDSALQIATENASDLRAEIRFVKSDLFEALGSEKFDVIVSNPPYIADHELLLPEVSEFEPKCALFSGPTGLEFYERLARDTRAHLKMDGLLIVEVGHTQAEQVRRIFERNRWTHLKTLRDLSSIERVVVVTPASEDPANPAP